MIQRRASGIARSSTCAVHTTQPGAAGLLWPSWPDSATDVVSRVVGCRRAAEHQKQQRPARGICRRIPAARMGSECRWPAVL